MALNELLGDAYKEGMSEEELSQAFEKVLAKRDAETAKLKTAFNKASSDVAKYKKNLEDKMSDEEKKANEQKELLERLQKENAEFKKQSVLASNKAELVALGYNDELAVKASQALYDGDMKKFFGFHKTMLEEYNTNLRAENMKATPTPPASAGGTVVTKEYIMSIKDSEERQAAIAQHIELFR